MPEKHRSKKGGDRGEPRGDPGAEVCREVPRPRGGAFPGAAGLRRNARRPSRVVEDAPERRDALTEAPPAVATP